MRNIYRTEGFTLVELMIVVDLTGILAAIAIPQFLKYQYRSKTTEATRNLGAIKSNQEAFAAKWNAYVATVEAPAGRTPNGSSAVWSVPSATGGFSLLGFAPTGAVYYNYASSHYSITSGDLTVSSCAASSLKPATVETTIGADASGKAVVENGIAAVPQQNDAVWYARGDLDGDGVDACHAMSDEEPSFIPVPGRAGESIF